MGNCNYDDEITSSVERHKDGSATITWNSRRWAKRLSVFISLDQLKAAVSIAARSSTYKDFEAIFETYTVVRMAVENDLISGGSLLKEEDTVRLIVPADCTEYTGWLLQTI